MRFLTKPMALVAILIPLCAPTPSIVVQNFSEEDICYKVEYSNGTGAFPNNATCGEAHGAKIGGFWLNSGEKRQFAAINSSGTHFNGAITAVLKNNTVEGARNEINLLNSSIAYYDLDYQYGISDGTCGPPNSSHLSGVRDTLGQANGAWKTLNQTKKEQLLRFPRYLKQDTNGSLVHINMDLAAWSNGTQGLLDVIYFFQITAGFKAYMSPGSVAGVTLAPNSEQQIIVNSSDHQTLNAPTDQIVVTSY